MDKNITPKISVLMPVFNCRQYIEESIFSILYQTFTDFEFIIIDDCSTDGTYEYLQSLIDPRIKLIGKTQNTGYTISLNMGLDIAQGEYIARMDGDDISFPDRFAKQVVFMDDNPDVVVCGGGYEEIGSSYYKFVPKHTNDDILLAMLNFSSPIAHPTVFLRNSILKNYNLKYDFRYEPAEDYKMWTILSEYGKLASIPDILLYYRKHQNQISERKAITQREKANLVTFEYVKILSKGNEFADFYCRIRLKTIDDFKKYEMVENDIKCTLNEKGIIWNEEYLLDRKRKYLQNSLFRDRFSIPEYFGNLKLILSYRSLLGNNYIFKYLVRSLITIIRQ